MVIDVCGSCPHYDNGVCMVDGAALHSAMQYCVWEKMNLKEAKEARKETFRKALDTTLKRNRKLFEELAKE